MNLAEEFTSLHEAWNTASVAEAPRARHAFSVFCHENAPMIVTGLYCSEWLNAATALSDFDDERSRFETWISMNNKDGGPRVLSEAAEGGYRNSTVQAAWLAWNARASGEPRPAKPVDIGFNITIIGGTT